MKHSLRKDSHKQVHPGQGGQGESAQGAAWVSKLFFFAFPLLNWHNIGARNLSGALGPSFTSLLRQVMSTLLKHLGIVSHSSDVGCGQPIICVLYEISPWSSWHNVMRLFSESTFSFLGRTRERLPLSELLPLLRPLFSVLGCAAMHTDLEPRHIYSLIRLDEASGPLHRAYIWCLLPIPFSAGCHEKAVGRTQKT